MNTLQTGWLLHMSESQIYQLHAFVSGRVQGVGFRYFTLNAAQALQLSGWVRNRYDGRVEVLAEGDYQALNQLLTTLRKGPAGGFVSDVDYSFSDAGGQFNRFSVRSTG